MAAAADPQRRPWLWIRRVLSVGTSTIIRPEAVEDLGEGGGRHVARHPE